MSTYPALSRDETIGNLPPEYPSDALKQITAFLSSTSTSPRRLVVLDDDPTGTQTCHDISVLTVWDIQTLTAEFLSPTPGFFILTNSRALPPSSATTLIREICQNVLAAATATGYSKDNLDIVLRGDSTLRGHFPLEVDVAQSVLGFDAGAPPTWVLAPFFFQGGRFTIDNVHYVLEGEKLVPAGETQFARDATFGYKSSNLRDYVLEKAPGRFSAEQVHSVSLEDIRRGGPEVVCERLLGFPKGGVVIANAAAESDMHVFVAGLLLAEAKGARYIYRTGAAFVSTRLGIYSKPPITAAELKLANPRETGGLILAGSYVPKTTAQLKFLIERRGNDLSVIEIGVEDLIASPDSAADMIARVVKQTEKNLKAGKDTLVMTSRALITGGDELSSLAIGSRVAEALVKVLQGVEVRPRYIIAKGGITSSDAATKGLLMKRALIVGQAAAGVPLWRCDEPTSRHQGVPFVVFPGNVGGESTLCDLVAAWS
ncbi:hypothetical protein ASPSYDRAFT_83906 [Aspergillus sydowii CBS 593.65]|uniref:Four-carbon acid sugar kinase nucleotide binding domain-containing protein n=1 Tax=Aspergillus sydowii CBS 593.65 TaxID=1036612 RepID=A0A1L9TX62_9EURO|nr:uncharacterized protein ASPSYDRAFT_83906 [Aspergillus sydowii CBS 593.65]OJJ63863.1 hypothetical protein ASPSYDRAFT_83906 [Aspergillus sydowii CBS 593.65]